MIDFIKEYGADMIWVVGVIISYTAAKKVQWFWMNKVKTEIGQYILMQKAEQFWNKAVAASTWLQVSAKAALAGRTTFSHQCIC